MQRDKLLLVVMYNISKSDEKGLTKAKEITSKALQEGYDVYGFSASPASDFEAIKATYGFEFEQLSQELKTYIVLNFCCSILSIDHQSQKKVLHGNIINIYKYHIEIYSS